MKLKGSGVLKEEHIRHLLGSRLNTLRFPEMLEKDYCFQYNNEIAAELPYRGIIMFMMFLFLGLGTYYLIPISKHGAVWLIPYYGVAIFTTGFWILSFFSYFNQWFTYYAGLGAAYAVASSIVAVSLVENKADSSVLYTAIIYAVLATYGFVGLRFYTAILASWLGGLAGVAVCFYMQREITLGSINIYLFFSFLGMGLAYITDRQHRENYLQCCLLELQRHAMAQQTRQLEILSRQDALTGIANRRYLDKSLQDEWFRAMRHQQPISILMIDIDHFKIYNDTFGHLAGDHCLIKIAHTLSSIINRSGEMVARYGGEEFMVVLPMTTQLQAIGLAKRLLAAIQQLAIESAVKESDAPVTISIGVASHVPQIKDGVVELINCADCALYQAKAQGRNCFSCMDIPGYQAYKANSLS